MTKELHLASTHGLSKAAQRVFTQILGAMQEAEEMGGTEDDEDYIMLMEGVAKEALERVETAKTNANRSPR